MKLEEIIIYDDSTQKNAQFVLDVPVFRQCIKTKRFRPIENACLSRSKVGWGAELPLTVRSTTSRRSNEESERLSTVWNAQFVLDVPRTFHY